jgi:phospholipid/cholesterol/gamma-HCH transport system substrate-binding protein
MKGQIPRLRLTAFLIAAAAALGLFLYLNSTFGGPTLLPTGSQYELKATFPDSQNLVEKSLVMYRGFQVGYVDSVKIVRGRAQVTFTISSPYAPLPPGTIAQVDHRTFLQEPFVNIYPGNTSGPKLRSGSTVGSVPTVEPDDALQVFDPETRRLLDEGTQSLARGLRAPNAGDEVNGTINGLDQVLVGIHQLASTLHGQEQDISTLVTSSATVLSAIASEQTSLVKLIGSGRTVAQTFADQANAFGNGLDQLNDLLGTAETVLPKVRPFLPRATATLTHAASTASLLTPALVALAPAVRDARELSSGLGASARNASSAFAVTLTSERYLLPLARDVLPTVENIVPLLQWFAARLPGLEAMIANTADTVNHGDSQGPWFQGFLDVTTGGLLGSSTGCDSPVGLCVNPYPKPGDARDPQPYQPGDFPRLEPYYPK